MGAGEWVVVILSIILAAWFLVGNYLNNRNSQVVLARLARHSSSFGKILSARFLASTSAGYRAMIKFESGAVNQVEIVMGFLRRENLPLWLFQLITRKSDQLTLNFLLRDQPRHELWVFPAKKAVGLVEQANRGRQGPLIFREEVAGSRIYSASNTETPLFERIKDFLAEFPSIRLLVLQKKSPHLSIVVPVKDLQDSLVEDFFKRILQLSA